MKLYLANRSIYNLLELAAAKREFIETELRHRKIGKTKALIEFAKDNNYTVLVGSNKIARMFMREYNYREIRTIKSKVLDGVKGFVFDECCSKEDVEKLILSKQPIITGFLKSPDFYDHVRRWENE